MHAFLTKFAAVVRGVVSGFDRLFLRGSLRGLSHRKGLKNFLWANRIPYKDFADYSQQVTDQLEAASLQHAQHLGREVRYLNSAQYCKEDIAREIAARDRIKEGLICVLRSVDPCMSFQINKSLKTGKLEIHYRPRKCLHLYHYQIHPVFGFMHARIQTWFPFQVFVCLNGREWLARQMDQAKLRYLRRDNTFLWLEDIAQTQALLDQQLQANWPSLLDGLTHALNPAHAEIFAKAPLRYYWSVAESEWATDVMFRSHAALENIYPHLVRYALTTFGAVDVLRFFGQRVTLRGKVPLRCRHEVSTNLKERSGGLRIKHWYSNNSLKMYDKGSVLRTECMLREPNLFKVFRPAEGNPEGPQAWRPMRLGLADLQRRAEVSQAANERHLQALVAVHVTTPLRKLAEPLCRPAPDPSRRPTPPPAAVVAPPSVSGSPAVATAPTNAERQGPPPRSVRPLNPLAADDATLLTAVSRHEFLINGLRNRDLRGVLFGKEEPTTASERRKRSAAVTRKLRLLRGHGLLDKVPKTHRYIVTAAGRKAITALLAARNTSIEHLINNAG